MNFNETQFNGPPLLFQLSTLPPVPTPTVTPTATATSTPTPNPTHTLTSTGSPTALPISRDHGSGTCWQSGPSWSVNNVSYVIDSSIPDSWFTSINAAANTWTDVLPSRFIFSYGYFSNNVVKYEVPLDDTILAGTAAIPDSSGSYEMAYTKINPLKSWDTSTPPTGMSFSVQNVMTHEFGHWLYLSDMYDENCSEATMDYSVATGEISKSDLTTYDIDGINYQYP
jgi:hypothetical protein